MNRKPTRQRREDIIDATLALLAEHPPSEVSTRDVAARVGISQPAIFKHFESRDALFSAVVDSVQNELAVELSAALEHESSLEALRQVCDKLFRYAQLRPGLPRLLVFDVSQAGEVTFHTQLRALVDSQRATFQHLLDREVATKKLPASLDTKRAAFALVALIQGTLLSWLHGAKQEPPIELARPGIEQWLAAVRVGVPQVEAPQPEATRPETAQPEAATSMTEVCAGNPDVPNHIATPTGELVPLHHLDVRPLLAKGKEPLTLILETLAATHPKGLLELVAPFEPRPLMTLVESRGALTSCTRIDDGLFRIWIRNDEGTPFVDLTQTDGAEAIDLLLERFAELKPDDAVLAVAASPLAANLKVHLCQSDLMVHQRPATGGGVLLFARRSVQ